VGPAPRPQSRRYRQCNSVKRKSSGLKKKTQFGGTTRRGRIMLEPVPLSLCVSWTKHEGNWVYNTNGSAEGQRGSLFQSLREKNEHRPSGPTATQQKNWGGGGNPLGKKTTSGSFGQRGTKKKPSICKPPPPQNQKKPIRTKKKKWKKKPGD